MMWRTPRYCTVALGKKCVCAGEAFHSSGVHMCGNVGAASWLHHSPGTEMCTVIGCCPSMCVRNVKVFVQTQIFYNCLFFPDHKLLKNFCSKSVLAWPPSALRGHLGPLGQPCTSVCQRSSLVCEPALFHHLNTPAAFTGWELGHFTSNSHRFVKVLMSRCMGKMIQ